MSKLLFNSLVFLDIEATSVNPQEAEIIELAYKKINEKTWAKMFRPIKPIPFDVSGITNIDNCMVEDRPIFDISLTNLKELQHYTAVCHNADYDLEILKRHGINFKNYICTYKLAWFLYPELPNHKLGTLRAFFGAPPSKLHRAEADVKLLIAILSSICLDKKLNPESCISLTQEADQKFNFIWQFGKYKGQEIDISQLSYIQWVLSNIKDLNPKFKQNLINLTK